MVFGNNCIESKIFGYSILKEALYKVTKENMVIINWKLVSLIYF